MKNWLVGGELCWVKWIFLGLFIFEIKKDVVKNVFHVNNVFTDDSVMCVV